MAHDDDVEKWDDDPLVRALRAPGTAAELAGQDEALAAYRVAVPRRPHRRLARRMGTGAGTFVVAVALSGGVAAAYTHTLPDPVQRVAHSWFGDLGVGAPTAGRAVTGHSHPRPAHGPGPGAPVVPAAHGSDNPTQTASTAPSGAPAPAASRRAHPATLPSPAPSRSPGAKPSAQPAPVTSPTPSPTPTSTPPRLKPAAVTATVSAERVPPGSSVTVSGQLTTSSGAPVPDRRVVVQTRPAGQHQRWSVVASARTDSSGDVTLDVPGLSRTTRLRLKAPHRVHSSVSTVVVLPTLAASITRDGNRYAVTVSSSGLQPGDTLNVVRRHRGHRLVVHRVTVDGSGDAGFTIRVPRRRDVTFRVVTRHTKSHAGARTTFVAPHR
jgi:hypothetical protein